MNQDSIRDYADRQRERYLGAGKAEKGKILDEVIAVIGYHRKAAIRLLSVRKRAAGAKPRGRPVVYGPEVALAAKTIYEASGGVGAKRLQPFVSELIARLEAFKEFQIEPDVCLRLKRASISSLERMLVPNRIIMRRKVRSLTKRGTLLRKRIPVRMFSEWEDSRPGFIEVDTVAHCGDSLKGFHLWTVTAVDVATGWIEMDVVWGKTEVRVGAAIRKIRRRLPVPLLGIDCDNGSEFINRGLYEYCQQNRITFTRSRPYHKNDGAHIEQKNGAVVRRLVGHGRYMTAAAFEQLQKVYSLGRLHANFFQPVRRLSSKIREGAKSIRFYDQALTPYQRMLAAGLISSPRKAILEKIYLSLNPLELSREIDRETEKLLKMAARETDPLSWSGKNKSNHNSEVTIVVG